MAVPLHGCLPRSNCGKASRPTEAELFIYPGDQHLLADSSLAACDPVASALLIERVQSFLAAA